jgi:hypothetical protein
MPPARAPPGMPAHCPRRQPGDHDDEPAHSSARGQSRHASPSSPLPTHIMTAASPRRNVTTQRQRKVGLHPLSKVRYSHRSPIIFRMTTGAAQYGSSSPTLQFCAAASPKSASSSRHSLNNPSRVAGSGVGYLVDHRRRHRISARHEFHGEGVMMVPRDRTERLGCPLPGCSPYRARCRSRSGSHC